MTKLQKLLSISAAAIAILISSAWATTFTQTHNMNGNDITNANIITVNQKIGIGVDNPGVPLEVNGHAKFGNGKPTSDTNLTNNNVLIIWDTTNYVYSGPPYEDLSDTALNMTLRVKPAEQPQGIKQYYAGDAFLLVTSSNNWTYDRAVGFQGNAENQSPGTIKEMRGVCGAAGNATNGTIINSMAGKFSVYHGFNGSGGGVTSNSYGVYVWYYLSKGTTIKSAGIAIRDPVYAENHTYALLGTATIPDGMYGVYAATSSSNYFNGDVGFGTSAPEAKVDIKGVNGYSQFRVREKYTPTGSADANGAEGSVAWDEDYIYIKTSAGWKRSPLSTF